MLGGFGVVVAKAVLFGQLTPELLIYQLTSFVSESVRPKNPQKIFKRHQLCTHRRFYYRLSFLNLTFNVLRFLHFNLLKQRLDKSGFCSQAHGSKLFSHFLHTQVALFLEVPCFEDSPGQVNLIETLETCLLVLLDPVF